MHFSKHTLLDLQVLPGFRLVLGSDHKRAVLDGTDAFALERLEQIGGTLGRPPNPRRSVQTP